MISPLLLLAATTFTVSASPDAKLAQRVDILYPRYPYAGGGWGMPFTDNCPAGTYDTGYNFCCPNTLEVQTGYCQSVACCPPGEQCTDAIGTTPFCADSSWVLWNSSTSCDAPYAFFCCPQGQQGTNNMVCESGNTNIAASLSAQQLGQPTPQGAAAQTATYSVSGVSSTSGATATASTGMGSATGSVTTVIAKTTVQSGTTITLHSTVTGLLGSLESLASHFAHSDAVAVRPLDFSGLRIGAAWITLVGAMVYGAFAVRGL